MTRSIVESLATLDSCWFILSGMRSEYHVGGEAMNRSATSPHTTSARSMPTRVADDVRGASRDPKKTNTSTCHSNYVSAFRQSRLHSPREFGRRRDTRGEARRG